MGPPLACRDTDPGSRIRPGDLHSRWSYNRDSEPCGGIRQAVSCMLPPALMPALALEWLNLLARWIHVIAAIMWIGDSFLFMWLDSSLAPPSRKREGAVAGELWMVHSGGFYEVV